MKKEMIFVMAMSLVSSLAFAANNSASDANTNAANPKGSFDSTPPATGDKGYGAYNGSTGEKAPKAGAGVSGSSNTGTSTSTQRDPASAAATTSGGYEGTASSSGANGSASGNMSGGSMTTTASTQGSMDTFNKLDKNKDGMLSKAEARKDKTVSKNFAKIDTDKDGKISQSEYEAYIGGNAGAGTSGSSSAAPGLKTDPAAGSANRGVTDTGAGTSGGAKDPAGNNIR